MQVKKHLQIDAITNSTGRLPSDMENLDETYFSKSKEEGIPIADMDLIYMIRAFKKLKYEVLNHTTNEGLLKENADLINANHNLGRQIDKLREDLQGGFKQSVDDLDVISAKDKIINELNTRCAIQAKTIAEYIDKVEQIEDNIEEKDQEYMNYTAKIERQRDMYKNIAKESTRLNGHYYTFSEVPQDEEGKEFIKNCKKYLNKESYAIRVKGQHLKKELYGQGRAYHGANMEDASHMRVYIDKK